MAIWRTKINAGAANGIKSNDVHRNTTQMDANMIKDTPWDAVAFGMFTGELTEYSEFALRTAVASPGHYTLKIDPLADSRLLHEYGFYYCDTQIEPWCSMAEFRPVAPHPEVAITREADLAELLASCHGTFVHGRFHRDFNLPRASADLRYDNWLRQLYDQRCVYGLLWNNELAGFIAFSGNSLVLHAVAETHRGRGLAKYWWSAVCAEMFAAGHGEIKSSISAANVAVLNLYASLGFRFRNPLDVYQRLVK